MGKNLRKSKARLQNRIMRYDMAIAYIKTKTAKSFNPAAYKRPGSEKKRKGR